jgi:DNA repair exonuclease SbcCD nuclease subunit
MLYQIMNLMFQDQPRITFNIPDGRGERNFYAIDKIGNYSSLLIHGDQFNTISSMGALKNKIYGWKVGAITKTAVEEDGFVIKEHFDDVFSGHFHTPSKFTFNTVQLRISGSPESTNTYAIERLGAVGRPSQPLLFVHPEKGIVTAEYNCWLD